jgi:uncharacterized protein (TIGR02466 family)
MMNRELFFATPIYVKDIGTQEFNTQLEKNIINWSNQDKGITITNVNGWHSTTDMHHKPEYKMLVDLLYQAQLDIYKQELLDNEPFLGNMWANINPPHGYNKSHMHANSLWSGVYYVKAPKNSGHLKIEDPKSVAAMVHPKRKEGEVPSYLWREVNFEPVAGRLIMFPAWLYHCVEPNRSNDIRISVSFNFLQKGMFV